MRDYSGEAEHRRDNELAVVVVVEKATGEPRVVGGHNRRSGNGVEVCKVHRLFAAPPGVPQIGIGHPHGQEHQECDEEQRFEAEHHAPTLFHVPGDLTPVTPPGQSRQSGCGQQGDDHRTETETHQAIARQQPRDGGDQQQAEGLCQQVTPIRQRPEHHVRKRNCGQRHQLNRNKPHERRRSVGQPPQKRDVGPRAAGLLNPRSVFAEQQPDWAIGRRQAGLESEEADDLRLVQPRRVFKHKALRMVVHRKALVRPSEPESGERAGRRFVLSGREVDPRERIVVVGDPEERGGLVGRVGQFVSERSIE